MAATRSRYHSRVYLRFMRPSIDVAPDWAGRWIARQMLGIEAIVSSSRSLMSFGCDVAKRTRSSGETDATRRSSSGNPTSPARYELTFCPSSVTSRHPFSKSERASATIVSGSRLRSRPRV